MPSPIDRLREFLDPGDPVPNKYTIGMGKLVRQAREEAGLSQTQLASQVYRRRATISDIENGKSELTVATLALIASVLDKPITYFLPWFVYANMTPEELDPLEHEALIQFQKIWSDDLKELAILQIKQIADTSVKQYRKDKHENPQGNWGTEDRRRVVPHKGDPLLTCPSNSTALSSG